MNILTVLTYAALIIGLPLLIWGAATLLYGKGITHSKRVALWFLVGIGASFLTFDLFPGSSAEGTILGFKLGSAIAALVAVWIIGIWLTGKALKPDEYEEQIRQLEAEIRRLKEAARRPEPLGDCNTHAYTLKNAPGKKLSLITGDIQNIKCADLWVSSENTNMEMARFYDRSVSASIRYYGATRDAAGNVTADLIADELKKAKGANLNVAPTSLFVTGPGELINNGVKQIFHVAAVYGQKPMGYRAVDDLEGCVRKALVEAEKYKGNGYKSILFPLMATGTARGELKPISKRLVETALSYLEKNPASTIDTVYFLTWSDIDLETCTAILGELKDRATPDKA